MGKHQGGAPQRHRIGDDAADRQIDRPIVLRVLDPQRDQPLATIQVRDLQPLMTGMCEAGRKQGLRGFHAVDEALVARHGGASRGAAASTGSGSKLRIGEI